MQPTFQTSEIFSSCTDRRWKAASPVHPTKSAPSPDLSTSTLKKMAWYKSHCIGPPHHSLRFGFPSIPGFPELLSARDIFSSPGFPNEHCEAYINKEMKHSSSRLRRKYHNHTNNINSLEKTLGAVNTLR